MIEHIEEGHCTVISRREFLGNVHHMHFRAEIMKAPDVFRANLEVNKIIPLELNLTSQPRPRHVHVANSDDDQSSMSVLLDQDDPSQMAGHKPIIPGKPDPVLMSFEGSDASISGGVSVTYDRVESETWPRLPSRPQSNITKGVRSMSIASNAPSVCGTEVSETNFSATTSRRAGLMVVPESYSSLRSANTDDSDSVASSYATVTKAINNENVWSTHSISPKLSKQKIQAVPKAKAGDWTTITREGQEHWQDDKKDDLLHSRWWDSTSADYNMERFIAYVEIPRYDSRTGKMMINPETQEPVIESIVPKYCCPFPGCEFAKFDTPQEFETHWAYGHQIQCRCPCCLKVFKSAASLVRHCESNSKCAVKYSDRFEQASQPTKRLMSYTDANAFIAHQRYDRWFLDHQASCGARDLPSGEGVGRCEQSNIRLDAHRILGQDAWIGVYGQSRPLYDREADYELVHVQGLTFCVIFGDGELPSVCKVFPTDCMGCLHWDSGWQVVQVYDFQ